jgi:chromosome segregation ATPase
MDKDRLSKIEEKLDTITEKLHETNIILAQNTQSLIIHEKRTDIAEKNIEIVQQRLEKQLETESTVLSEIEEKIAPIQEHVMLVNLIFKYVLPAIAAVVLFLVKVDVIKF